MLKRLEIESALVLDLSVVADVVVSLGDANVELGIGRDVEAFADAGSLPFLAAIELVFAGAAHALHDFSSGCAKGQCCRQYHAHRLLGAIGQRKAVADALAIKVNISLSGQGNAREMLGSHGERSVARLDRS